MIFSKNKKHLEGVVKNFPKYFDKIYIEEAEGIDKQETFIEYQTTNFRCNAIPKFNFKELVEDFPSCYIEASMYGDGFGGYLRRIYCYNENGQVQEKKLFSKEVDCDYYYYERQGQRENIPFYRNKLGEAISSKVTTKSKEFIKKEYVVNDESIQQYYTISFDMRDCDIFKVVKILETEEPLLWNCIQAYEIYERRIHFDIFYPSQMLYTLYKIMNREEGYLTVKWSTEDGRLCGEWRGTNTWEWDSNKKTRKRDVQSIEYKPNPYSKPKISKRVNIKDEVLCLYP